MVFFDVVGGVLWWLLFLLCGRFIVLLSWIVLLFVLFGFILFGGVIVVVLGLVLGFLKYLEIVVCCLCVFMLISYIIRKNVIIVVMKLV